MLQAGQKIWLPRFDTEQDPLVQTTAGDQYTPEDPGEVIWDWSHYMRTGQASGPTGPATWAEKAAQELGADEGFTPTVTTPSEAADQERFGAEMDERLARELGAAEAGAANLAKLIADRASAERGLTLQTQAGGAATSVPAAFVGSEGAYRQAMQIEDPIARREKLDQIAKLTARRGGVMTLAEFESQYGGGPQYDTTAMIEANIAQAMEPAADAVPVTPSQELAPGSMMHGPTTPGQVAYLEAQRFWWALQNGHFPDTMTTRGVAMLPTNSWGYGTLEDNKESAELFLRDVGYYEYEPGFWRKLTPKELPQLVPTRYTPNALLPAVVGTRGTGRVYGTAAPKSRLMQWRIGITR